MKKLFLLLLAISLALPFPIFADIRISQLSTVSTPANGDEFVVNQAGISKKMTLLQILNYTGFPLHATNTAIHRSINDAATGTTDLWSANKINTQLNLKTDKVDSAVNGHFAGLNGSGNLTDSGFSSSSFAPASHNHSATDINTGTLPVTRGGTGQTTYTDGQLLIGRSSDNSLVKSTLTAGTGISITNGGGSITVTNTNARSYPPNFLAGSHVQWISATTVRIKNGFKARSSDDTYDLTFSADADAVITSNGAGGLDTVAEAGSTWYWVWAIGDSTGVNSPKAMLSTSKTSPTMPTGYDKKRLVSVFRNNASSNLEEVYYSGDLHAPSALYPNTDYKTGVNTPAAGPTNLTTTLNTSTFAAQSTAAFVPPNSQEAELQFTQTSATNVGYKMRPTGSSGNGTMVGHAASGSPIKSWARTNASQSVDLQQPYNNISAYVSVSAYRITDPY